MSDLKQRLRDHIAHQALGTTWHALPTEALARIEALEKELETTNQLLEIAGVALAARLMAQRRR